MRISFSHAPFPAACDRVYGSEGNSVPECAANGFGSDSVAFRRPGIRREGYHKFVSMKCLILLLLAGCAAHAETHSLTLQQALEIASRQNPDVLLARLDEQRANQNVKVTQDPFYPKLYAGSGAAYTSGYPSSIGGDPPSIIEVKTQMSIYNKPRSYLVAASRENVRGTQIDAQAKTDDVAFRIASIYLDYQQATKQRQAIESELSSLGQAVETMQSRVVEGAELPVEVKRAKVNLAQAQQELDSYKDKQDYTQMLLAVTLGFPAKDRVTPVEPQQSFDLPSVSSEDESVQLAIRKSKDIRRLQSAVLAKELELRSYKAARLPQVDLVAQYNLFAKYVYQDFFTHIQRNNGQIGASFVIPLLVGSATRGQYEEAATDMAKLRLQIGETRDRITVDTKRSYQDLHSARQLRDLARQQLDLAHDDLSVLLSRYAEGREVLSNVEKARTAENQRWLAMYEAEAQLQRAKLGVLRQLGDLMATLRSAPADSRPMPGIPAGNQSFSN
jgi:outer membrane protein